ncbi:MAG: hypothetical protein BWX88_04881 [Planctomycetes bacterium ADurb.Bin126]|nr:MAG: hypothetical protein BWX88_04881 [Planctomycetes bacterium ADurb.Bin126]
MAKVGAKLKFPKPKDYAAKNSTIMCPAERVLGLYNQDSGDSAQRIAKKVRAWFAGEAAKRGWAGVHFLKQVPSTHGAGCVLWQPPTQINISITVTKEILVLHAQTDGGEE